MTVHKQETLIVHKPVNGCEREKGRIAAQWFSYSHPWAGNHNNHLDNKEEQQTNRRWDGNAKRQMIWTVRCPFKSINGRHQIPCFLEHVVKMSCAWKDPLLSRVHILIVSPSGIKSNSFKLKEERTFESMETLDVRWYARRISRKRVKESNNLTIAINVAVSPPFRFRLVLPSPSFLPLLLQERNRTHSLSGMSCSTLA